MQSIDMESFDRAFDPILEADRAFAADKAEMLATVGRAVLGDVTRHIAGSGMKNGGGRLQSWQKYYVGSKRGYVAVRAIAAGSRDNSPGAITNYTENGHRIRRPSGSAKQKRRSRAKVPAVPGYHYYRAAAAEAEQRGTAALEQLAERTARRMRGTET